MVFGQRVEWNCQLLNLIYQNPTHVPFPKKILHLGKREICHLLLCLLVWMFAHLLMIREFLCQFQLLSSGFLGDEVIYIYCCFFAASRNNVHTRDTGRRMYLTDTVLGYTPIAFHLILFHLRLRDADDDNAPGWTLRCRNHSCRTFLWVSYSWKTTVGWNECHPLSGYYKLLFVCFDLQLIGKCNFCLT